MAYGLKIGRPLEEEMRRIADRQLAAAIEQIRSHRDDKRREAIHVARRHVKKVRALLRLVRPVLEGVDGATERRLRSVNQMFAPITDGRAIATTWSELARSYRHELPQDALAALRDELERQRAAAVRQARFDHVLQTAATILGEERKKVAEWRLTRSGFRALAPGLEKNLRAARGAMTRSVAAPTFESYHIWRRRVKTLWLQVRLLESRCSDGLVADRERLELLDGVLGECHDCALLQNVLRSNAPLRRQEAAHCLRVLRRHQAALRARAQELGRQIHEEKPRRFVRRVKRLWQAQRKRTAHSSPEVASWLPAA